MSDRLSAALILSAPPGHVIALDDTMRAARLLEDGSVFDDGWITQDVAWRALFSFDERQDLATLRAHVRAGLPSPRFDVNVVPDDLAFTKKRLLAADMESTLIEQEMIDEAAREIGVWEEISRITAATMRGEIPFEASLRQRIQYFEGMPLARLLDLAPRMTLMPGAEMLFRRLRQAGIKTAIITGGFSLFAEMIGERLGADHVIANRLHIENGRLTGRLLEPVIGVAGKEEALNRLAREHSFDLVETAAVGDGANDLGMLTAAGLGVAFRSKPKVREAQLMRQNGAVIDCADLSALLDLQGLSRGEVSQ